MKALVIYDSLYGNTEKVARAIAEAVGVGTKLLPVGKIKYSDISNLQLLIVGSPTQGGKPKQSTIDFLNSLPTTSLTGTKAAAFDTRLKAKRSNPFMGSLLRKYGYAAPKISKHLRSKGAEIISSPKGFIVRGKEGPLQRNELNNAKIWATSLLEMQVVG